MLIAEEPSSLPGFGQSCPIKVRRNPPVLGRDSGGGGGRAIVSPGYRSRSADNDHRFYAVDHDRQFCVPAAKVDGGGGFSLESEHDLALMVRDFWENGSSGAESRYSSDSDSGLSDHTQLSERLSFFKHAMDQAEIDLSSAVHSILLSIMERDLHSTGDGQCNASCIRQLLVKHLRVAGYDAANCTSNWQSFVCAGGHVPGGDHEYVDVIYNGNTDAAGRMIIDIDFHSHFEIARAVKSYDALLASLPAVYVGSFARLNMFLQLMVEAAKSSLQQNSMPVPPWRSLAYLQAKWYSEYERTSGPEGSSNCSSTRSSDHLQCIGHLRRLKASVQSEVETERLFKPIINDTKRRVRFDGQRPAKRYTLL